MANDLSALSATQAQLLAALMEMQSQTTAISSFLGGTDGSANSSTNTTQADSFSTMLSSVLGMSGTPTWTPPPTVGTLSPSSTTATPVAPTASGNATAAITGTATGQQIATVAQQLATDLRGPNNRAFDATQTPQAAQQAFDTPGWGNGNVQCVAFVAGAYRQGGITLPATPNATDFWGAYANRPGWNEVANGQGLPQPGDIIVMGGGTQGFGHVAVVTSVTPPANGQPRQLNIAQSNSPTATASLTLAADGSVTSWPGYPVKGFIRPD